MARHLFSKPGSFALPGRRVMGAILALVMFSVLPGTLEAQIPDSASVVEGRVFEQGTGAPLAGAAVSLASGPGGTRGIGTRVTGSGGGFSFQRVPPGTYRLVVTLIGYRDRSDTLRVGPATRLEMELPLTVSPIPLEPILVVTERLDRGIMGDFERRRRQGFGTFFDREDIEDRDPYLLTDLLRMVPGVRVVPNGPYDYSVRLRGNCQPGLWIDGVRLITSEGMDDILPTLDLEAVEVYHSATLPAQFGAHSCGGIVVWTRRGAIEPGEGSFWRRLAMAAGLITLSYFFTR